MSELILPGDSLREVPSDVIYGPGIYQSPLADPRPVRAGLLVTRPKKSSTVLLIDSNGKRYIPAVKDHVIGVVVGKLSEGFRVLLQEHSPVVRLGQFAFENASKKNRPNLATGTLVYGRISMADPDIEAEMECFDATTGKAAGFGELKGGYVVEVSLAYARMLLFEGGPVLAAIGEIIPFEVAIGMNGKIWIDGPDVKATWKIAQCIQKSESLAPQKVKGMVTSILSTGK
jgi:exosome complex component RRP40